MKIAFEFKKYFCLEAFIWIIALVYLFFISAGSQHFTFCPFTNLGSDFCPGCGLGKSIHYFLHFEIYKSLNTHPFGIFAFFILSHRIYNLLRNNILIHQIKGGAL